MKIMSSLLSERRETYVGVCEERSDWPSFPTINARSKSSLAEEKR